MERQQTSKAPQAEQQHRSQHSHHVSAPIHPVQSTLFQLQSQPGNRAVVSLLHSHAIQAKLNISQPGDPYEQETDQVAGQVMSRMHTPTRKSAALGVPVQQQEMQDEDEEVQMKALMSNRNDEIQASQILHQLDSYAREFDFPMLDNVYFHHADVRLTAFRSTSEWLIAFEEIAVFQEHVFISESTP